MEETKIKRCAVYTRKSHEIDRNQEYNSLEAQREAAENYIASQKANGWQVLPEQYDDGGFSGGNMERPALKRLLADVRAGKIDIICVYKMDRLSRSLLDFMKLAEMLEQHNVSFVSVTQDINTSTSAGRMMLNILMTFAQFEREIVAERIRTSVVGKKKRGKYCGGRPILGYDADPDTKKLLVNEKEAELVRHIFRRYCELASAQKVARELNEQGYKPKIWKTRKGTIQKSDEFKPDTIYRMLNNLIYIGKVPYKGSVYEGEHEAIIDPKLWDNAKKVTEATRNVTGFTKKKTKSPFKGLLKCGYCGGAFGITYSNSRKKDRRYMYYFCVSDDKKAVSECPLVRVPAGEIDKIILQQLSALFRTPTVLAQAYLEADRIESEKEKSMLQKKNELEEEAEILRKRMLRLIRENPKSPESATLREKLKDIETEIAELEKDIAVYKKGKVTNKDVCDAFNSIDVLWDELFPAERYRLAHLLIERITIFRDNMKMELKTEGIASLAEEVSDIVSRETKDNKPQKQNSESVGVIKPAIQPDGNIALNIPIRMKHKNGRKVIIAPKAIDGNVPGAESPVKEPIAKAIARSHSWLKLFESGEVNSVVQLAEKLNLHRSYVGRIMRMVNLAPDIQEAIIKGDETRAIKMETFKYTIPDNWEDQRRLFGMKP